VSELKTGSAFAGFRIEGLLARGGMGNVYLAREPGLDRRVALKVIRPEFADDETFRRRFASESRAAAAIEHPGVVSVYRAGEDRGRPYLAMRYVRGRDLQARLAGQGALPPARAASLVAEVAEALDAIHAAGLVHRDVKPANVIVGGENGRESAYLTDFGLAKAAASSSGVTRTGEVIGSLDYLAPEQIEGRRVDARTDVYALGCVLFQLVTGEVPFPGTESSGKLWAHINDPPPAASARAGAVLAPLDPVLRRAMAKDPAERFLSAGDLGRAAMAAVRGRPVTEPERPVGAGDAALAAATLPIPTEPRPATTAVRPRRRRLGRRIAAATAALAAIGLGVGAAVEGPELLDQRLPVLLEGGGAPAAERGIELPDLTGERLDLAEQELRQRGFRPQVEGGGLFGIVVPENWEVCESRPAAGEARRGAAVRLEVDRPGAC
jgi:predicted Ser/Thr protein kinase